MVYLSKIYTRSGDDGTTGLGDGSRVAKTHPRIASYGDADELGAVIGIAAAHNEDADTAAALRRIQNDLFDLGADLCVPEPPEPSSDEEVKNTEDEPAFTPLRMTEAQVLRLESEIDAMNEELEPLKSFVLSGGNAVGAHLHLARTVARRCERHVLTLAATEPVNDAAVRYLNRLSDWLFVAARFVNRVDDSEVLWKPGEQQSTES